MRFSMVAVVAHRVRESGLGVVKVGVKRLTMDLEGILVVRDVILRDWGIAIVLGFLFYQFLTRVLSFSCFSSGKIALAE